MHFAITFLSMTAALVGAQATYNRTLNAYLCPSSAGTYCAGASLATNIIIRCTEGIGRPGNCNDNLAGIPPQGVKGFAPCYEPTPSSGQAACSYANIVYPEDGRSPFPIALPGSFNKNIPDESTTTTTRFANSSHTSSTPAKITAGFVDGPYVSNIFNTSTSSPAVATASIYGMAVRRYAPNPGYNDTRALETSVTYTGLSTGMASTTGTPTGMAFTGGVGKPVPRAWATWLVVVVFGVMAVQA